MNSTEQQQAEQAPRVGTGTPFSVWLALVIGLGVAVSWHFPSGWMVVSGIVLIVTAWCMLIRPEKRLTLVVILIALALLITVAMPKISRINDRGRNVETKQNLYAIQDALERYGADNEGVYPLVIDQLRHEHLTQLPPSPYWYKKFDYQEIEKHTLLGQMQPLGADYFPPEYKVQLSPIGNFCYVPRLESGLNGELTASGYLLLAFGQKRWHPDWTTPPRVIPLVLIQLTDSDEVPSPY